jgi:hypothetical protein
MNTQSMFILILLFFTSLYSCRNGLERENNKKIINIFYTQTKYQFPKDTSFSSSWLNMKNRIIKNFESTREKESIYLIVEKCKFDSISNENNCKTLVFSSTNGKYIGRIYHKRGVDRFEPYRGFGVYGGCHRTRNYYCSTNSNKNNFRLLFSAKKNNCYFEIISNCQANKIQNINNNCTDEMISETVKKINDLFSKME